MQILLLVDADVVTAVGVAVVSVVTVVVSAAAVVNNCLRKKQ